MRYVLPHAGITTASQMLTVLLGSHGEEGRR